MNHVSLRKVGRVLMENGDWVRAWLKGDFATSFLSEGARSGSRTRREIVVNQLILKFEVILGKLLLNNYFPRNLAPFPCFLTWDVIPQPPYDHVGTESTFSIVTRPTFRKKTRRNSSCATHSRHRTLPFVRVRLPQGACVRNALRAVHGAFPHCFVFSSLNATNCNTWKESGI